MRKPESMAANQMGKKRIAEESKLLPDGFLNAASMCLLPTFYQPETEELRWATHLNIRKTLFFSVFRNIKYCEFKHLKNEEDDFFELELVDPSEKEGMLDKMIEQYWSNEKARGKLVQTQKWTIKRTIAKEESEGYYRVKVYHMDDDEFKCKLYPYSWLDTARYLWFDRNFLRIL